MLQKSLWCRHQVVVLRKDIISRLKRTGRHRRRLAGSNAFIDSRRFRSACVGPEIFHHKRAELRPPGGLIFSAVNTQSKDG